MSRPWADRVLDVLDEIHARLDDDTLEPAQLADHAGFSRHHFHRVFRGMTGESVMGLVRRLRMERAAQRLRFGDAPVTDVALASGYGSHEAFTRAFRDRFGV
ncbi:MAG: helix-turn-helix transcriptional regulator, partial [Myxococcota bacterium]